MKRAHEEDATDTKVEGLGKASRLDAVVVDEEEMEELREANFELEKKVLAAQQQSVEARQQAARTQAEHKKAQMQLSSLHSKHDARVGDLQSKLVAAEACFGGSQHRAEPLAGDTDVESGLRARDAGREQQHAELQQKYVELLQQLAQKEQELKHRVACMQEEQTAVVTGIEGQCQVVQEQYRAACDEQIRLFRKNCTESFILLRQQQDQRVVEVEQKRAHCEQRWQQQLESCQQTSAAELTAANQQCEKKVAYMATACELQLINRNEECQKQLYSSQQTSAAELAAAKKTFQHTLQCVQNEHAEWSNKQAAVAAEQIVKTEAACAQKLTCMKQECKQQVDGINSACAEDIATAQRKVDRLEKCAKRGRAALLQAQCNAPKQEVTCKTEPAPAHEGCQTVEQPQMIDSTMQQVQGTAKGCSRAELNCPAAEGQQRRPSKRSMTPLPESAAENGAAQHSLSQENPNPKPKLPPAPQQPSASTAAASVLPTLNDFVVSRASDSIRKEQKLEECKDVSALAALLSDVYSGKLADLQDRIIKPPTVNAPECATWACECLLPQKHDGVFCLVEPRGTAWKLCTITAGAGTEISRGKILLSDNSGLIFSSSCAGVKLQGLLLCGGVVVCHGEGCNVTFSDVTFEHCTLVATAGAKVTVTNCNFIRDLEGVSVFASSTNTTVCMHDNKVNGGEHGVVVQAGASLNASILDIQQAVLSAVEVSGSVAQLFQVSVGTGHDLCHGVVVEGDGARACMKECTMMLKRIADGCACISVASGAQVTLEECVFWAGSFGVFVDGAGSRAEAHSCLFRESVDTGVLVQSRGVGELHNCTVEDSLGWGVRVKDVGTKLGLRDCHIERCSESSFQIAMGATGKVHTCTLLHSGVFGVEVMGQGTQADVVDRFFEGNSRGSTFANGTDIVDSCMKGQQVDELHAAVKGKAAVGGDCGENASSATKAVKGVSHPASANKPTRQYADAIFKALSAHGQPISSSIIGNLVKKPEGAGRLGKLVKQYDCFVRDGINDKDSLLWLAEEYVQGDTHASAVQCINAADKKKSRSVKKRAKKRRERDEEKLKRKAEQG